MPTFLADPPPTLYLLLAVAVIASGAVWAAGRKKNALRAFLAFAALLGGQALCDWLTQSPRESGVAAVKRMAAAADAKNPDRFLADVADTFEYTGEGAPVTIRRDKLKESPFWALLKQYNISVRTWDFTQEDTRRLDDNTVEFGFLAKGEADGKPYPLYLRATFGRQPDGSMQMTKLATFDPVKRTGERKGIPGFP